MPRSLWQITVPADQFLTETQAELEVCDAFPVNGEVNLEKLGPNYVLTVPSDIEDASEIKTKLLAKSIDAKVRLLGPA